MIARREFITLLGGAAVAWPLAVRAQQNVVLELRYAPGNPDALREVIAELTRRNWDLAVSSGPAIRAMKAATDIPVLFAISGDPVELGLVGRAATLREARSFRSIWPEKEFNC